MGKNKILVITGAVSNLLGTIGKKGLAALVSILLVRSLTVNDFGVFNLFVSLITTMGALSFGVDKVFQRFYPLHLCESKEKSVQLFNLLILFRYLICIVLLLIVGGMSYFGLLNSERFNFPFINLAIFFGFFFLGQVFFSIGLNAAYLEHKFLNATYIVGDFFKVVSLVLFLDSKIYNALMLWGIGEVIVFLLVAWRFFWRLRPKVRQLVRIEWRGLEFRRYFNYVKYMILASGSTYVLSTQVDLYFISYYVNNETVGFYAFASKIPFIMLFFAPSNLMFNVMSPLLFRKIDEGADLAEITSTIKTFLKLSVIAWTVLMGVTLVNLKVIITYVFDVKYIDTMPLICVWFILLHVNVIKNVFEPVARAIEYTQVYVFTFVAAIVNIVGNLILIPIYGISGAIASTGFSMLLQGGGISVCVGKKMGLKVQAIQIISYAMRIVLLIFVLVGCHLYLSSNFSQIILSNLIVITSLCLMFWPRTWFSSKELGYVKSFLPIS